MTATRAPAPVHRALAPGTSIGGGRHVLKHLGGGDRYQAYVAWDATMHAPVVAKVLRPHLVADARGLAAIAREAVALERLAHPDLVRGFGSTLDGDHPHLVLEYLDGPRLSTLVRQFGPLSPEQLILLARRVAGVLAYFGEVDWVHLDIKPRNLVMTATPKVIDLSVARPVADARGRSGVGTRAYMAPEQADPARAETIGPASDIWGLGATLYEAVTGIQAFPSIGDGPRHPQLTQRAPALPERVPPLLAETIVACLAMDPTDRPTAPELIERLEPLADWAARSARRLR